VDDCECEVESSLLLRGIEAQPVVKTTLGKHFAITDREKLILTDDRLRVKGRAL
jgi:hypothetical protein